MDDNFGLSSDIEGFEDEESDEDQSNFFPDPDIQTDDVTLAAVGIEEGEESPARGRPRNTCVNEYEWSSEAFDVNVTGFTQPIGILYQEVVWVLIFYSCLLTTAFLELFKGKQIATPARH